MTLTNFHSSESPFHQGRIYALTSSRLTECAEGKQPVFSVFSVYFIFSVFSVFSVFRKMLNYQIPLLNIDRLIKLGEVERVLSRIFQPSPSRPTLVGWIEDGTLEGKQIGRGDNYYVYESSLNNFIHINQPKQTKLVA